MNTKTPVEVKICGMREAHTLKAAAGADYAGFVSYAPSPRHISLAEQVKLRRAAPPTMRIVVLTVDADDAHLAEIVREVAPDMLQLHGRETPARVRDVRARFGLPVIKAIPVAVAEDLDAIDAYRACADTLLFDAKPPATDKRALPGGRGEVFDWRLLAKRAIPGAWMLSGGLTAGNVADAIRLTGAPAIDVSSGVESAPGRKDPALVDTFIRTAKEALL